MKLIQEIFSVRALRALSYHDWWPVGKLEHLNSAPGCSVHERRDLSELKEFSVVPLQGFHHSCLFYSYQSYFISESLQLCLWGKWNSTRCKSKGLCFVLFGIGDLLRRKLLLRELLRINVWLPEGTKGSRRSLSPSAVFLSGLTFHHDLTVCSEGGSNSHLLVSFCQEGAAPSAQAGQPIAQVPHPDIRTHTHTA